MMVVLVLFIEFVNLIVSDNLIVSIVVGEDLDVVYVFHWSKDGVVSGLEGFMVMSDFMVKGELWIVMVSGVEIVVMGTVLVIIFNMVFICI